jgi:hypothetical protein
MEVTKFSEDLSEEEQVSLQNYISNGCPGLVKIDDTKVFKWFELYMSGKSYSEIATITREKKDLIVYIAHRGKWHEKHMQYYADIASNLTNKIKKVKLESANTVATAITALGKYYGDQFNKYLLTNDSSIIANMDTKTLAQYYKSIEVLDKMMSPNSGSSGDGGGPSVNINVGSNAKIEQKDDKTVEITTDEAAGDLIKALAKYQRVKEKDKD